MQFAQIQTTEVFNIQPKHSFLLAEINHILATSVGDHPNFDMVAHAFNMSGRTLRRQLAEAGTSYQKLVDEFRRKHAQKCLLETDMTTDDIADSLGFSDVANFRHAFKKWVGMSPAAFRMQLEMCS